MNIEEIEERTIRSIQNYCYGEKVKLDSAFREDLDLDRIDKIELVMALEEVFEIDISDKDAESIFTVKEMVDYLAKRLLPNVLNF